MDLGKGRHLAVADRRARSRSERSFERDRPAPRSSSSEAPRICSAVGRSCVSGKSACRRREYRRRGLAGQLLIDDRLGQRGKDAARRLVELHAKRADLVDDASERRIGRRADARRRSADRTRMRRHRPQSGSLTARLRSPACGSFVATPPCAEKPPILPPAASTRWHGTTIGNGLRPSACPTARAAPRGAEPRRDLAVGERLARRDGARHLVDPAMERRHAVHVERDRREVARLAVEQRDNAVERALHARRRRAFGRGRETDAACVRGSPPRPPSGSCTPTMPRSPQATPHRPIAVSKSVKPNAVMTRSYHPAAGHSTVPGNLAPSLDQPAVAARKTRSNSASSAGAASVTAQKPRSPSSQCRRL